MTINKRLTDKALRCKIHGPTNYAEISTGFALCVECQEELSLEFLADYIEATGNKTTYTFATWNSFVNAAVAGKSQNPKRVTSRDRENGHDAKWSGTDTWEEAVFLAKHGWPEGLKRIKKSIEIIDRFMGPKQTRYEQANDLVGPGIIDVDRFQQGRPDVWQVWEAYDTKVGPSTEIVHVVYNISTSSGVDIETMFHRGAAVTAMIDIMEQNGIRVELTLVSCGSNMAYTQRRGRDSYNSDENMDTFKITIKKAEEALDLDRIAFALCNAATFRRLVFSLMEQNVENLNFGYGRVNIYREEGAMVLDPSSLEIRFEHDMVPWLKKQLKGYGIQVDE